MTTSRLDVKKLYRGIEAAHGSTAVYVDTESALMDVCLLSSDGLPANLGYAEPYSHRLKKPREMYMLTGCTPKSRDKTCTVTFLQKQGRFEQSPEELAIINRVSETTTRRLPPAEFSTRLSQQALGGYVLDVETGQEVQKTLEEDALQAAREHGRAIIASCRYLCQIDEVFLASCMGRGE